MADYQSSYTGAEIDEGIGRASSHASRHAVGGADEVTPSSIGAVDKVNGKADPDETSSSIVSVTSNKTLSLTDAGTLQQASASSPASITITVPTNASVAFPVGTEIEIVRYGTGDVTIAPATGVTISSVNSIKRISDQYATVGLKKMTTNVWLLTGSLA